MITCSCGKTIEKVPTWMQSIKVDFVCNNCPNRQTKNIAFVTLETEPVVKSVELEVDEVELDLEETEEPA